MKSYTAPTTYPLSMTGMAIPLKMRSQGIPHYVYTEEACLVLLLV